MIQMNLSCICILTILWNYDWYWKQCSHSSAWKFLKTLLYFVENMKFCWQHTQQNRSPEANCCSCSQKICHHLRNPNVYYSVHIIYHRTNLYLVKQNLCVSKHYFITFHCTSSPITYAWISQPVFNSAT